MYEINVSLTAYCSKGGYYKWLINFNHQITLKGIRRYKKLFVDPCAIQSPIDLKKENGETNRSSLTYKNVFLV